MLRKLRLRQKKWFSYKKRVYTLSSLGETSSLFSKVTKQQTYMFDDV